MRLDRAVRRDGGRVVVLLCFLTAIPAHRLTAQCPDGSPPPCRQTASLAGRVPSIALSDNVWLILPFENSTRAADAELVRQASVSQLYGELSRWAGLRVVPEDRVADLLQSLPAAQRERVGLESARTLARRVGAGRIVMGSYLAAGGRANVTARVYETRSGRELRAVRDALAGFTSAAALDSLTTSFGRLAAGLLDVPAEAGVSSAGVGTASMEAYRAYIAGMAHLNHIRFDSAVTHFDRAIRLDSGYAQAWVQRWRATVDTIAGRRYLESAMRLSAGLPRRDRALMAAMAAAQRQDRAGICANAAEAVAADSSDAQAWSLLSICHRDQAVVVEDGKPRVRGDFNAAVRAAERAYALNPTLLGARINIINTLAVGSWMTCVPPGSGICPPEGTYRVSILPGRDSLIIIVNAWADVRHAPPDLTPAAIQFQVDRFRRAARICESAALAADSRLLHQVAAQLYMAIGDVGSAETSIGRGSASALDTLANYHRIYFQTRLEIALARERPQEVRLWAESLFALPGSPVSQYKSMLGRLSEGSDSTVALRQSALWRQILVGVVPPGFDSLERQMAERFQGPQRDDFLQLTTLTGFHLRRSGPALDTAARHPLKRHQAWFARGEAAKARAALGEFDRELLARHPATPDDGGWLFSAESHLELGDSATALQRMQEFGRRWSSSISGAYLPEMQYFQSSTSRLWGRAWLLYADLAMARNASAEARRAYRMVVGLWEQGEAPVQPLVARARAALASLPN